MTLDINFIKKFENNFTLNVNLSNYSWFNLGGNAEYFLKAKDKKQLIEFLREAKKNNLKTTILGAGSNTLFRDNGVKGAVIKLGNEFSYTKLVNKNIIDVGGSTLDRKVANFAKENNLGNLEFLSCIPGSVGGAIIMNSGCYEDDISKVLLSVQAIDKNNLSEIEIKRKDIEKEKNIISESSFDYISNEIFNFLYGNTKLNLWREFALNFRLKSKSYYVPSKIYCNESDNFDYWLSKKRILICTRELNASLLSRSLKYLRGSGIYE